MQTPVSSQEAHLRSALGLHLTDEQLATTLRIAETKPDRLEYLEGVYRDLVADDPETGKAEGDLLTIYGLTVECVQGTFPDMKSGQLVKYIRGYEIVRREAGQPVRFAGQVLRWTSHHPGDLFQSESNAKAAATAWAALRKQRESQPVLGATEVIIRAVYCPAEPIPDRKQELHCHMTIEETHKMNAILRALQELNVHLELGKPVRSLVDVFRVILKSFPSPDTPVSP